MASTKTRIKPIRIKNETADYFENRPLNRMVESLESHLKNGKIKFDGEELVVKGGNVNMADIEEMANLMRVTPEKILSDIRQILEDGNLYYIDGKLRDPRYADLEDICTKKGVKVEHVLMKAIREIENGK